MIMYVALALEHDDELTQVLQHAYEYFLVDEHQDTNDAQNKIIELIRAGKRGQTFLSSVMRSRPSIAFRAHRSRISITSATTIKMLY